MIRAIFRSLVYSLRELWRWSFGRECAVHSTRYRSDLCPLCVRQRIADADTLDIRPEWTKSVGAWPVRREGTR